jgi:tetratricopeptide (TPR) repeat protein
MKKVHVIRDMQTAHKNAEKSYNNGDYQGCINNYQKALHLCQTLPQTENFDKHRFEASIHAGLSGALGRMGKHMESFAAANMALVFYEVCGENYPADTGRWLMAQVNQGTALAALGCFPAAIEALLKAKQIFTDKGLDAAQNKGWLEIVEGNIAAIKAQLKKQE